MSRKCPVINFGILQTHRHTELYNNMILVVCQLQLRYNFGQIDTMQSMDIHVCMRRN